jgi:hypothetical protein
MTVIACLDYVPQPDTTDEQYDCQNDTTHKMGVLHSSLACVLTAMHYNDENTLTARKLRFRKKRVLCKVLIDVVL